MTEDYDSDQTLEAYGYGKSGKGKTIVIVVLSIFFLAAVAAAIVLGKLWSDDQSKVLTLQQQVESMSSRVSELENKNAELSSLLADKQAETERLKEEWATQVETLQTQHKEQLQRTYGQMNEIVYDSRKTLAYIGDIETRLREGANLDKQEVAKLTNVVNGLAFLHEQYKKPLAEFRELDRYFAQQLAEIPADQVNPAESTPLGKRIFKAKQFKEERNKYFADQGRRSALVEAKSRVASAYASAQRQMASVSLDVNQYLLDLENVIESNEKSAEDVAQFFEKSKEILKIHDRIMNVETPSGPSVKP